jgi:hypothetical protein
MSGVWAENGTMRPAITRPRLDHAIGELATRQHGVIAREQLDAVGLGSSAVRKRVASGQRRDARSGGRHLPPRHPCTGAARTLLDLVVRMRELERACDRAEMLGSSTCARSRTCCSARTDGAARRR